MLCSSESSVGAMREDHVCCAPAFTARRGTLRSAKAQAQAPRRTATIRILVTKRKHQERNGAAATTPVE